ncbi:MAG: BNR/Asp-box repeat domain protein [Myxococcaceae bacterium]|nr:BNR/Asp-box repeat domain protein [Myxococcaceae bacterium]
MRIFPGIVVQRAGLCQFAAFAALSVSAAAQLVMPSAAHASGPVERMVEVLLSPSDPNKVVVRWGFASEGYLFSTDGGQSFKAMCSQAITPNAAESDKIKRLTGQNVPGAAATLIDTHGKLVVSQIDGLWTDDGTGCNWTKQLDGQWPYSILRDPKTPDELIAVVNTHTDTDAAAHLMRRDADGSTWTKLGALLPALAGQHAYGGDLIASRTQTGTQLYAGVTVTQGSSAMERELVVGSSDGGKTWTTQFTQPPEQGDLTLLAIDPSEPRRILATVYRDSAPDTLLLSEDQGKTFSTYFELRETAGVTFAPDGRIYIADAGDSTGSDTIGGLYTAAKLGDPLTLVAGTSLLDCATYDPSSQKLFACKRDKVGLLDPVSGAFSERSELTNIPDMVDCPGVDMVAACLTQLNAGASWCCAGHYPFTPFCGQYDVTMRNGQRLYCGISGRIFDQQSGRGPADAGAPAGALDAGKDAVDSGSAPEAGASVHDAAASVHDAGASVHDAGASVHDAAVPAPSGKKSGDGCSLAARTPAASPVGALAQLGFVLLALGRVLRRRRR